MSPGVLLNTEVLHDLSDLLPVVHGLLELHVALGNEHVDNGKLLNVAVALKLLSDLGADLGSVDLKDVEVHDLGGLIGMPILAQLSHPPAIDPTHSAVPVAVGLDNPGTRIVPVHR